MHKKSVYKWGEEMIIAVAFLKNDCIYHTMLEQGKKISIGSHKKDDVIVPELDSSDVVIRWKTKGIHVNAKKKYNFDKDISSLDSFVVLDKETKTAICFHPLKSEAEFRLKLPYNCVLNVGRAQNNHIVLNYPYVSGNHFILKNESGNVRVEVNENSNNGLYLNGKLTRIARMKSGDVLSLFCIRIKLFNNELIIENAGDRIFVAANLEATTSDSISHMLEESAHVTYQRSPRTREQLPMDTIVLAPAPSKGQKYEKRKGSFASLLSSGTMFATGLLTSAASPALMAARAASLVFPISNIATNQSANKRQKQKSEEYELMRREKYGAYIDDQKARIESVAKVQRDIIVRENPSPEECMDISSKLNRKLWERSYSDKDFLDVRVGMGYEKLCVNVQSRAEANGFQMEDDEIRELTEQIVEETRIVDNIPARIPLKEYSTLGFVGERQGVLNTLKNMLVALATMHSFEDVKIIGIFDESELSEWEFLKWLPHCWDAEKKNRFLSFNEKEAHILCEYVRTIVKNRKPEKEETDNHKRTFARPHYIVLFGSKRLVEREEVMDTLFTGAKAESVSTIFLFNDIYSLPHGCEYIVDMSNGPCAYKKDEYNNRFYFMPDSVIEDERLDSFARNMSAIELLGFTSESNIPDGITFLEGYGVKKVHQLDAAGRWRRSKPYETLAAPMGMRSGNKIFALDIHEKAHGPHGLVAGTTGSGKSETLQTWILSMALNYHPYDVNFVIIDYKGGGMANLLEPLPHVVGKITNISSNIARSLISLKSESKRRQMIFDRYGVNHIDKYQKLYREGKVKEPVPHLIIVSDEFAELKKEEPEFISELISISRIGRSLGVHLVLATQKPSGVVDDNIWSNSHFHLCLKVQDVSDSKEMIKRPDAAMITQSGRAYIQVGMDEYFDLFQSFWSGASYSENDSTSQLENQVRIVEMNGQRIKTTEDRYIDNQKLSDELTEVIKYINNVNEQMGLAKLPGPWCPDLPERIYLEDLKITGMFDGETWGKEIPWLRIPLGMYDAPARQAQGVLTMDLSKEGHHAIYGSPCTGKTTMLKTIVASIGLCYTPQDVNIYILDFGGWSMREFENMPHVGGVLLDHEEEKFDTFYRFINDELMRRKKRFIECSVNSLEVYRELVAQDMAAIVIMVDNILPMFERYSNMEELFITLAREGATYGMYIIYTANNPSGVRYRVTQNIKGGIALELADKGDYTNVVGRLEGMTLSPVVGRAFIKDAPPLEFQTALYTYGENELERVKNFKQMIEKMKLACGNNSLKTIQAVPENVKVEEMKEQYTDRTRIPIGIEYDEVKTAYVDMSENSLLFVCGDDKKAYVDNMSNILQVIHSAENEIYVFDGFDKVYEQNRSQFAGYYCIDDISACDNALDCIVTQLNERISAKAMAQAEEDFKEDSFLQQYKQIVVVIGCLKDFVIEAPSEMIETVEQCCRLGKELGVIVMVAGDIKDVAMYKDLEETNLIETIADSAISLLSDGKLGLYTDLKIGIKAAEKGNLLGDGVIYLAEQNRTQKIKFMQ